MKNFEILKKTNILVFAILLVASISFTSCGDDEPEILGSTSIEYFFHNGQTVSSAAYAGFHPTDFTAKMDLQELVNGNTNITVTINNTISGATYHMHAHDGADSATTPNGTPFNETPNSSIFAQAVQGNGNSVTITQEAMIGYDELVNDYEGFFVIHDPLQTISTVDISTYLIVGGFARNQSTGPSASNTFNYAFNTGQLVSDFAYVGEHSTDLTASIQVDQLMDNKSRITVRIMNTMDGQLYHTHAHDMADASTTPNGTPYLEAPNSAVFAAPIMGNGGMAARTQVSDISYDDITSSYDGFFVVHDPLQGITTVDPTTYVILGVFAR